MRDDVNTGYTDEKHGEKCMGLKSVLTHSR